jgi:hypothetical protein
MSLLAVFALRSSILTAIWTLGAWLYLRCGLSRERSSKAMHLVFVLVLSAVRLGRLMVGNFDPASVFAPTRDVRTAISHLLLEPELRRSVCCPKCFSSYSLDSMPGRCTQKETKNSKVCGEPLWMIRRTRNGPKRVPRRLYTTQSFPAWLEWFLSRPGIEDHLDASYRRRPSDSIMRDIWDTPSWRSLGAFTTTYGNLTFSYYIDWFNPLTNKIAGKQVSCGAIMMFCLNLPPELRHLPENTFFVGLTPPPHSPTVTTITALQDPIMEQLVDMQAGRTMKSFRHPDGLLRRVAVLPFIADLGGIQKACGFAQHNHAHFCPFCDLLRDEIERLDIQNWPRRSGIDVRITATQWTTLDTKVARKALFDATGVRGSSLHALVYRDHVRHLVLGVMHNWVEGVLQTLARRIWGIGVEVTAGSLDEEESPGVASTLNDHPELQLGLEDFMDVDDDALHAALTDELASLSADSQQFGDTPSGARRQLRRQDDSHAFFDSLDILEDPADSDFMPMDEPASDGDETETDGAPNTVDALPCVFNESEMARIHDCIRDVVRPTWMESPPKNLGQPSHGKLKADNWLTLFSVDLLMCLPRIWGSTSNRRKQRLLENFFDVVSCTNIVTAFSTSNEAADDYMTHFIRFRREVRALFPDFRSVPNFHYGMHNGDLLKFWGPLMHVSEWPYERHNGTLQKISTNGHFCELRV